MSKKSLLSLFLVLLLSIAVSNAKIRRRIHGGRLAWMGQFKHQVSLQISTGNCSFHFCGGAILDKWNIITAAHCVTRKEDNQFNKEDIVVVAGTTDLRSKYNAIYRDVAWTMIPKSYNPRRSYLHDVAILRLRRPLPLGSDYKIQALKLPKVNEFPLTDDQFATVSGFGRSQDNGRGSPVLRYTYEQINQPNKYGCSSKLVCTRPMNNEMSGVCKGDSGSALVGVNTDLTDLTLYRDTLIGITSHFVGDSSCGTGARYTRISEYLDFIRNAREMHLRDIRYTISYHQSEDEVRSIPFCVNELIL
ncbi:hypothetical protein TKK_0010676 [Trichogramma kaykai]